MKKDNKTKNKVTKSKHDPLKVTQDLLADLKDRARDILVKRFGLGSDLKVHTLESIGKKYGITRERVRQLENASLALLRKSKSYAETQDFFDYLISEVKKTGGFANEDEILDYFANNDKEKKHYYFYLVLSDGFVKHKEDGNFKHRWSIDPALSDVVHSVILDVHKGMKPEDLLSKDALVGIVLNHEKIKKKEDVDETKVLRWLRTSKKIAENIFGDWGLIKSPNVSARGARDYAYLVLRRQGDMMHFKEVAKSIGEILEKDVHTATIHNELIKDDRFVLVGRGLYALKKWGYRTGSITKVITGILKERGPLSRDEIVESVLRERHVKQNTILVNLSNKKHFTLNKKGLFQITEEDK